MLRVRSDPIERGLSSDIELVIVMPLGEGLGVRSVKHQFECRSLCTCLLWVFVYKPYGIDVDTTVG